MKYQARISKFLSHPFQRVVWAAGGLRARDGNRQQRVSRLTRRTALAHLLILLIFSLGMLGCSSGTVKVTAPTISLVVTQAPPASLLVGGTATVSATVSNDIANAGVDWVAVCSTTSGGLCGSFSPAHTDSGATTTFTAPADVPTKNTVSVTALSATDHSKSTQASVSISSTVTGVTIVSAPVSLVANAAAVLSATVAGDPTNAGAIWTATCADVGNNCGLVGGTPLSYTAPNVPPPGNIVTLTATSMVDHNFSVSTIVTILSPVSIAITQPPPSGLPENATANVIAIVSNDPTSAGVDWSLDCQITTQQFSNPCGSVSPAHTASGVATTYTAPQAPPPSTPSTPFGQVHVIAKSTLTSSVTATSTVIITPIISVAIETIGLPKSLFPGNSTPASGLIATVTGDPTNAGVDWSLTCGSADCGSFSAKHASIDPTTVFTTPTTIAVTYTAPATVPTGGRVTIVATSTNDPSKSDHFNITILAVTPDTLLKGQFVFLVTGRDANQSFYSLAGTLVADGQGNITGGEADVVDSSVQLLGSATHLSASTYKIGADGRGQISITLPAASGFGVGGSGVTWSVAFVTPKHALLSESDSFGSGTGTLDLQNAADLAAFQTGTASLNGTYSVALSGAQMASPNNRFFLASALTTKFDTTTNPPTDTETAAVGDQSDMGVVTSDVTSAALAATPAQISVTVDGSGRFLDQGLVDLGVNQLNLIAYLIDANHFVITDGRDPLVFGGYMVLQPASPAISGTFAFSETGATPGLQPQVAGGILSCNSSGVLDVTPLSATPGTATVNQAITSGCTQPTGGRGVITISGAGASGISQFAAYPTLDMGLQLIEIDSGGPTGGGVALQQTATSPIAASALNGKYGSTFLAATAKGLEGLAGRIVSDGASTLSGTVDVNSFDSTAVPPAATSSLNASLSGSSYATSANGRFPVTLNAATTPTPQVIKAACYIVDANSCLLLGLDVTTPGRGVLQLQNLGF